MADEKIIYLSADEELTNVREALEKEQARHITFIIPPQTHLRSLVGWKLLHARARELSKDVLVISPDRQIRSVVKAAGFKVAESLNASPNSNSKTGRSAQTNRSGRPNPGGKQSPRQRSTTNRGEAPQTMRRGPQGTPGPRQPAPRPPDYPAISDLPTIDHELETNKPRGNDPSSRSESSSTFGASNRQFGPNYDYRVGDVPSIHPLSPSLSENDEEEPDYWLEDVSQAQSLRDAAAQQDEDTLLPPPDEMTPPMTTPQNQQNLQFRPSGQSVQQPSGFPAANADDDPLSFMDDVPSSPLPEQHGSIPFEDLDNEVPDISEYPTDIMGNDIEDLGDQGNFVESPRSWVNMLDEDEQDEQNPPRVHGFRPRSSRSGTLQPPPRRDFDDEDEEDALLPPVYEQPTRIPQPQAMPPVRPIVPPAASAGTRTPTGKMGPQPVAMPQNRRAPSPTRTPAPQKSARPRQQANAGVSRRPTPTARPTRQSSARPQRAIKDIIIPLLVGLLIFLFLAALAFVIPSADVTVGVPFKSFSSNVQLAAGAKNTTGTTTTHGSSTSTVIPVAAQTLTYDTSVSGRGQASGSAPIGDAVATGTVNFSNKSSQSIDVPTGTQLATSSGVVFVTTLDVIVPPNGSSYVPPVTVQAQNPGTGGNVAANTIVNITSAGQQRIIQFNPSLTSTSVLGVTNPSAATGGGAGHATALSQKDINTLQSSLNTKIQTQFKDWLTRQLHTGDQAGKAIQQETITTSPAVGSVVNGGTFTGTLKLHATVLVVRSAAIQAGATTALNKAVSNNKTYPNYTLFQPQQLRITKLTNTAASDGKSLTLKFTASGQIIPNVSANQVRSLLVGKRVSDVQSILRGPGGIPGVVTGSAKPSPGFFPWVPFWSSRITVHIVPAQAQTTPHATASPTPTATKKK